MIKRLTFSYLILVAVCAFMFTGIPMAEAQDEVSEKMGEFGIRLMPTYTALNVQSSSDGEIIGSANLGFGAGLFLGFNFTEHVGIQAEFIYSAISQKVQDVNIEQRIKLRYINVPFLLSLNTGKNKVINLNLVAGPQIGFNVGSSLTTTGNNDLNNPEPILSVKGADFGFAYGAGIDFGLNTERTWRLGLGYRGVSGLLDISDNNHTTTTNSYYVLDRSYIRTNAAYVGILILF